MRTYSEYIDLAYTMFHESDRRGLQFHYAEDEVLNGRTIEVQGRTWLNFASCSYLGLETDPRLKRGVIEAVERYGTQFSSSRGAVSAPPYRELESLLDRVFDHPTLPTPSTSLGHIAAIPVLIQEGDLMILDQQVHASVQTAANLARVHGARLEVVRHSRLDLLEELIVANRGRHKRIWYLADGLYSMYGDLVPMAGLRALLDRYEQLHLYIDDAHAMSWCGAGGRGFARGEGALHPRMVLATSLNKAFACAGGVLLVPDETLRSKLRTVGGPLIFSGPIQPPMLGAAVASARLHLSAEFPALQADLLAKIRHANRALQAHGLPLVSADETPVRFVGTGLPRVSYNMVDRLQREGFFLNVAVFPVVAMKQAGLRFTITRHMTPADISRFADAVAHHLPLALAEEGSSLAEVRAAFGLDAPQASLAALPAARSLADVQGAITLTATPDLTLEKTASIDALDAAAWDALLGDRGTFSAAGLRLLERVFGAGTRPEDRWRFLYYVVRDAAGHPVLATFFTEALWKDDMIASTEVSRLAEQRRAKDPYQLSTRTLAMGSLLTEGDHLYLDRDADWRGALGLLLKDVAAEQAACDAPNVVLRDLAPDDAEMEAFLLEQGFAKYRMPASMQLPLDPAATPETWLTGLTRRSRRFLKAEVLPRETYFTAETLAPGPLDPAMGDRLYQLYQNVHARSLEFNTFALPRALFEAMATAPEWELTLIRLAPAHGGPVEPVAFLASYVGADHYVPLVVGLDYAYVKDHGAYRQAIWTAIRRARAHGARRIHFGMGATLEKHRFGAEPHAQAIYFQASDTFNFEVLLQMMGDAARGT